MDVSTLQTLSTVFFVLAGVLFVVACILFFYFDVIHLIGDVTGSTARKAIEDIRKGNEISGDKAYKPSAVNKSRGKLTDKISPSGKLVQHTAGLNVATSTEKLTSATTETTVLDESAGATTVLSASAETIVLSQSVSADTTMLNQSFGETTVLAPVEEAPVVDFDNIDKRSSVILELEMGFIGSAELIE